MNKLSDLRVEIKSVEDELAQLQAQLTGASTTTTTASANLLNSASGVNQNQTAIQPAQDQPAQESTFDPIESAYHCLELAVCLLQDLDLKSLAPQLRSLCDTLILPNIGSVHEHIRLISVRALNLVCILKLELAQKYVPLLIEIINCDQKPVIIEAFKALINVIMAYSLNKLVDDSNTSINAADEQNANLVQEATSKILSVMTSLLDYDDSEISTIAVEGFCKLYMTGHILSAKLFSKLVIMYYSPLTENEVKLRACLSAFLPQFSFFRSVNQLCVEESFMITLKCLMNAPADSCVYPEPY
jgi:condensin complex subunit 3